MMVSRTLKLIEWPWSQVCMECSYGQFVEVGGSSSCYLCHWDKEPILSIPADCPQSIPTISEQRIGAGHGQNPE